MCLILQSDNSKTAPNRTRVWKVVEMRNDGTFIAPYRQYFQYEIGKEATPETSELEVYNALGLEVSLQDENAYMIEGGAIHVYTTLKEAQTHLRTFYDIREILECEVDPQDHVADGFDNEAAYLKIKPLYKLEKPRFSELPWGF